MQKLLVVFLVLFLTFELSIPVIAQAKVTSEMEAEEDRSQARIVLTTKYFSKCIYPSTSDIPRVVSHEEYFSDGLYAGTVDISACTDAGDNWSCTGYGYIFKQNSYE
ncbi:hypothetical protein [Mechercharimyces sp. CAU 1602]|uniref:hypothetical protein n=1 Tax=Mechercharimyces sp. CAU 1602 TaxID=2973933 RepID=UPI002161E5B4|nr:hypothetical protein [Mechercharimyces sp. CAU 1602]MCS1351964.1 hypothetical protein [Mechercharimyces sp. CAU 1602]